LARLPPAREPAGLAADLTVTLAAFWPGALAAFWPGTLAPADESIFLADESIFLGDESIFLGDESIFLGEVFFLAATGLAPGIRGILGTEYIV